MNLLFCSAITAVLLIISSVDVTAWENDFVDEFMAPQNAARAALGLQPLEWDGRLVQYAEWYANQRRSDCLLKHSRGPYGENIFWGAGDAWTPVQAANAWVGEKPYYDYGSNSCAVGQQCGHYTQIVWSTTTRIGCARVTCVDGKGIFMTCNYDPLGITLDRGLIDCLIKWETS